MSILDPQNVEIEYRRWIIFLPVLMILIGGALLYVIGPSNSTIGLIGGIMAFIGVLTFGTLLSVMIGVEMASRMLAKKVSTQSSFREKMKNNTPSSEAKEHNKN